MDHQDPIVMASGAKIQQKICWRYCTEPESILNPESTTDNGLNLIALGRTGDGKSSLLNDFMGAQVFKQKISAKVRKREVNKKKKTLLRKFSLKQKTFKLVKDFGLLFIDICITKRTLAVKLM